MRILLFLFLLPTILFSQTYMRSTKNIGFGTNYVNVIDDKEIRDRFSLQVFTQPKYELLVYSILEQPLKGGKLLLGGGSEYTVYSLSYKPRRDLLYCREITFRINPGLFIYKEMGTSKWVTEINIKVITKFESTNTCKLNKSRDIVYDLSFFTRRNMNSDKNFYTGIKLGISYHRFAVVRFSDM